MQTEFPLVKTPCNSIYNFFSDLEQDGFSKNPFFHGIIAEVPEQHKTKEGDHVTPSFLTHCCDLLSNSCNKLRTDGWVFKKTYEPICDKTLKVSENNRQSGRAGETKEQGRFLTKG